MTIEKVKSLLASFEEDEKKKIVEKLLTQQPILKMKSVFPRIKASLMPRDLVNAKKVEATTDITELMMLYLNEPTLLPQLLDVMGGQIGNKEQTISEKRDLAVKKMVELFEMK